VLCLRYLAGRAQCVSRMLKDICNVAVRHSPEQFMLTLLVVCTHAMSQVPSWKSGARQPHPERRLCRGGRHGCGFSCVTSNPVSCRQRCCTLSQGDRCVYSGVLTTRGVVCMRVCVCVCVCECVCVCVCVSNHLEYMFKVHGCQLLSFL
jgi:hypothetical protein